MCSHNFKLCASRSEVGSFRSGRLDGSIASRCRPGARGYVEMSCRSSRINMSFRSGGIGRNVVPEQQDRTKCRPEAAGQVEISSWSSRTGRNVVREPPNTSKCRPGAAGHVEISSRSRRTSLKTHENSQTIANRQKPGSKNHIYIYIFIYLSG